jgi:hypothetical protein
MRLATRPTAHRSRSSAPIANGSAIQRKPPISKPRARCLWSSCRAA